MGFHATTMLAYGIDLGEEQPPNVTEEQWEEIREEWGKDEIAARGYDLIIHCSYDYPMYFLAIPGTEKTAYQGYPKPVDYDDFNTFDHHLLADFIHAMEKLGADTTNLGWHIMGVLG